MKISLLLLLSVPLALLADCRGFVEKVGCYVDPNIGGVAPLLTTVPPQVNRPHGMMRVLPITKSGLNDRYFPDKIYRTAL